MKVSRRQALGLLAGAGVGVTAAGCSRALNAFESPKPGFSALLPEDEPDRALLTKFGFGPRPGDIEKIKGQGRSAWFEEQLAAPEDDDWQLMLKLRRLDIFHFTAYELRDLPEERVISQLQSAAVMRATDSKWQLRERMVDFWTNHFNIFARKGLAAYRKPQDERQVVRAHVFGKFPEMLLASAKSTAMLLYLDQQASNFSQPNENYARELLELHSLGVDGGYTQQDVMEAARCFTGWTEERQFLRGRGQFKFRDDLHDQGEKTVLGHKIAAGGDKSDGYKVVEIVANHPSTARHVSRKMARFFLGAEDPEVIGRMAVRYQETGGDIKELLRVLYEAFEGGRSEASLKRPFDFAVSTIRSLDGDTDGGEAFQQHLRAMGQPLYQWPMPDGYPDQTEAWTGSLLARWNFASALVTGQIRGTQVNLKDFERRAPENLTAAVLQLSEEGDAAKRIAQILPDSGLDLADQVALCLSAPEFQWR